MELQDRETGRRLAATRLADEAQRLSTMDGEVDAIDRTDGWCSGARTHARMLLEVDPQIRDREERTHGLALGVAFALLGTWTGRSCGSTLMSQPPPGRSCVPQQRASWPSCAFGIEISSGGF